MTSNTMADQSSPKIVLITANSPILLRVLKLNLENLKLRNNDHIELLEYLPGSPFGRDRWIRHNSVDLIVAALSSAAQDFRSLLSQTALISEIWKIRLLLISDDWPTDFSLTPMGMRLDLPLDLEVLYSTIESSLKEQVRRDLTL